MTHSDNQHPDLVDAELQEEELLDDGHDSTDEVVAGVSAWGISVVVHVIAVFLLLLVWFAQDSEPEKPPIKVVQIEASLPPDADKKEHDIKPKAIEIDADKQVDTPMVTELDLPVEEIETDNEMVAEEPAKGLEDAVSSSQMGGAGAFMAIGAGGDPPGALGNRNTVGRHQAVGDYGGSRASESAVEAALRWFSWHQSPNGQWDVDGYPQNCEQPGRKCDPGKAHTNISGDVATTGYAVLCYLGAGYDHRRPNRWRHVVQGGIEWLLATQKPDGLLGRRNYEHPVATMALAEAYAMSNDPRLREPAQKAVDVILKRQTKLDEGYPIGWNYSSPNVERNDSSVTGWNVMALKSAKAGNLDVGQGLEGSKRWLEGAWKAANPHWQQLGSEGVSGFPYTWNAKTDETRGAPQRASIGALAAVFLGYHAGDPMLESLGNWIMAHQVPDGYPTNTYYMYYNTLAIFQLGGNRWKIWNDQVRDMLVGAQRKDDCFNGSWDWQGSEFHGHDTGRLLSTAYCTLSLEVYYRYLPIAVQR